MVALAFAVIFSIVVLATGYYFLSHIVGTNMYDEYKNSGNTFPPPNWGNYRSRYGIPYGSLGGQDDRWYGRP
jgi:hypothetical protein